MLVSVQIICQTDLSGQQLLLLEEDYCLRGQSLQICQLNGTEEQLDVRATGLETLRQMGRIGTPLCHAVAILESDDGICYIPYQLPIPSRTIGLVWRKTSGRSDLPTDSAADELGKHKVMSLRNIALTAPYGHNGAMATLEQIVHFYI